MGTVVFCCQWYKNVLRPKYRDTRIVSDMFLTLYGGIARRRVVFFPWTRALKISAGSQADVNVNLTSPHFSPGSCCESVKASLDCVATNGSILRV